MKIIQNTDKAIAVINHAGAWLYNNGMSTSKWWDPKNLNLEFLGQYISPNEFYVVLVDEEPTAAVVLQQEPRLQDWGSVDKGVHRKAFYVDYVAVERKYAGHGLVKVIMDFAGELADKSELPVLRIDANADQPKLRKIYEDVGFKLVTIIDDSGYGKTAYYEKAV